MTFVQYIFSKIVKFMLQTCLSLTQNLINVFQTARFSFIQSSQATRPWGYGSVLCGTWETHMRRTHGSLLVTPFYSEHILYFSLSRRSGALLCEDKCMHIKPSPNTNGCCISENSKYSWFKYICLPSSISVILWSQQNLNFFSLPVGSG